ncbi:MAG: efflux RND transporter periplasmic adaptor subunit [Xanthomonadaceae bacterium]|nr:efflux RND transporter periplasmic adaptor subunit [Xanthomonadaceae bacterium]
MSTVTARKALFGVLALMLVLGGFRYLGGQRPPEQGRPVAMAPVRVAAVERRDMPVVVHALGTVLANALVNVAPRVQGSLESASFREGQFVERSQLLFQIDPKPFQASLAQAKAVLSRDEALLKNASLDRKRYDTLYDQHTISAQARDTATANVSVLAATVEADRAALDLARINLGYTQIRAPISGKTGPLLVQPGNMVASAGATVLVTIAQIRPVKLSFDLPQSDLPLIRERMRSGGILVAIDTPDGEAPRKARVDFVGNAISSQSDTVELRASFPNADLSLLPGQVVNVTATLDDIPAALVVPHDAINDGPEGNYIYVLKNGHAVQQRVTVLFEDARYAAVRGDLTPGDAVIVEGQLRVVPNGAVQVIPPASGDAEPRG